MDLLRVGIISKHSSIHQSVRQSLEQVVEIATPAVWTLERNVDDVPAIDPRAARLSLD
jgi:hypothetical protein